MAIDPTGQVLQEENQALVIVLQDRNTNELLLRCQNKTTDIFPQPIPTIHPFSDVPQKEFPHILISTLKEAVEILLPPTQEDQKIGIGKIPILETGDEETQPDTPFHAMAGFTVTLPLSDNLMEKMRAWAALIAFSSKQALEYWDNKFIGPTYPVLSVGEFINMVFSEVIKSAQNIHSNSNLKILMGLTANITAKQVGEFMGFREDFLQLTPITISGTDASISSAPQPTSSPPRPR